MKNAERIRQNGLRQMKEMEYEMELDMIENNLRTAIIAYRNRHGVQALRRFVGRLINLPF